MMNLNKYFNFLEEDEDKIEEEVINNFFKKDEEKIEEIVEKDISIDTCIDDVEDTLDNIYVLVGLIRRKEKTDEVLDNLADTLENLIESTENMIKDARRIE